MWPRYAAYRERHRTVAPDSSLADQCNPADIEVPDSARRIVLTAEDGTRLGGAVVGVDDARTAVLLRQGAGQRICQRLPFAERLASEAGVQVVLDRRGRGSSPGEENLSKEPGDLQTASDWATSHGASRIVLLASSMGNSVMFNRRCRRSFPRHAGWWRSHRAHLSRLARSSGRNRADPAPPALRHGL